MKIKKITIYRSVNVLSHGQPVRKTKRYTNSSNSFKLSLTNIIIEKNRTSQLIKINWKITKPSQLTPLKFNTLVELIVSFKKWDHLYSFFQDCFMCTNLLFRTLYYKIALNRHIDFSLYRIFFQKNIEHNLHLQYNTIMHSSHYFVILQYTKLLF